MGEVLRFFQTYEYVIYFVLGIGVLIYGWRFWTAWQEVRGSIFGLEQISGQRKLNRAAISIFVLMVVGFVVFSLVTFVVPVVDPSLVLEDLSVIATTAVEEVLSTQETVVAAAADEFATATPLPTVSLSTEGCIPGSVEITSPQPGEAISDAITVTGTANVENFGFYKFEIAHANEELWLTIQAGRQVVVDGNLVENFDTSLFAPGEYVLQLVVTKNDGEALPACRVPVLIGAPTE